ncbi:MAG: hypothetical protein KA184_23240 [Candidatus Hydrogenedentes bacterium]|nr:hypothetical protein [Candidatus Hydrogenedentota bacterium]
MPVPLLSLFGCTHAHGARVRLLARRLSCPDGEPATRARTVNDGADFVSTHRQVILGLRFASMAVVGPSCLAYS